MRYENSGFKYLGTGTVAILILICPNFLIKSAKKSEFSTFIVSTWRTNSDKYNFFYFRCLVFQKNLKILVPLIVDKGAIAGLGVLEVELALAVP